jgi:hypothetical protein
MEDEFELMGSSNTVNSINSGHLSLNDSKGKM